MSNPESEKNHLVRGIGLGSGIAIVIGGTIGSGIFKSPSGIAEQLPGPLPMLAVWIVGGLLVLCGGLTLAEIGSAFPYSGGQYVYIREAFGRLPAFLFGWVQLVLAGPAGTGALAVVFGQYAVKLIGSGDDQLAAILAIIAVIVVTTANVRGVRFGVGIQVVTTVAKTGGLLALIVLALAIGLPKSGGHFTPLVPTGSFSVPMFGLALVSALWAYDGWVNTSFVSGEFINPRRNFPLSILIGTIGIIAIYLLANVAYLSVSSVSEISKSDAIAADTMGRIVGANGVKFIVATVMLSTFGTMNSAILTNPRVFFAMAEDNLFFPKLAEVHPKYRTPHAAIIVASTLGVIYILLATKYSSSKAFGALTDAFVIGNVPFYILMVASVFVFRKRERQSPKVEGTLSDSLVDVAIPGHLETHPHSYNPSVRVPLFPFVPVLFLAANLFLIVNSLVDKDSRIPTLITLGIVVAGIPVYFTTIGRRRT